jgi:hypothetical protein
LGTAPTPLRRMYRARVAGRRRRGGTIASERVLGIRFGRRSPGPLRSPSRLQNTFAHEVFLTSWRRGSKADPGRLPPAPPERRRLKEVVRQRPRRRTGRTAVAAARRPKPASRAAAASAASRTKATTATSRWWPRSRSIRRPGRSTQRLVVAQDCGPVSNPTGCAISSRAARCRA